jgi:transposase-like protein
VSVNGEHKERLQPGGGRTLKVVQPGIPDSEVTDKAAYRSFTKEYKARILQEVEQCERGELGALLRREGIYSSTLAKWRKQREKAMQQWLEPQQPGPKPAEPNPLEARVAQLEKENTRLQQRLKQAETIIEVQKNLRDLGDSSESASSKIA